jgi:hypothetical protein
MAAGLYRPKCNSRQLIVARGNQDRFDISGNRFAPIRNEARSGLSSKRFRPYAIPVANDDDIMPACGRRTLGANQPASNNRETH